MKDPYVHAEKTLAPGFGNAAMRGLIVEALGTAPSMPKTVGTGCGRRRSIAATSTVPEHVTCLPCREWARADLLEWAGMADAAREIAEADPALAARIKADPARLADEAAEYRAKAARYALCPEHGARPPGRALCARHKGKREERTPCRLT